MKTEGKARIFIGGLPADVLEMELVVFVSNYAEVSTIKIVRDKVSRRAKGYAFLEMLNQGEAEKAVARLNGRKFKSNTITVRLAANDRPTKPANR